MSLNLNKLEKVRKLENGIVQARCPACAEGGADRAGNHLRIMADGRFGCCIHPKSGEHRKRIFALAGEKSPGTFTVRVKVAKVAVEAQSVKAALTRFTLGTPGTGETESVKSVPSNPSPQTHPLGTLGTPFSNPYAYRKNLSHMYKGLGMGVPSVLSDSELALGHDLQPTAQQPEVSQPLSHVGEKLPYLTADGTLVIPFDSPERYHWWKPDGDRLSVAEIMAEVKERINNAVTI
jgi:hypothetical protein